MENNLIDSGKIPPYDPNHNYDLDIDLMRKYLLDLGRIVPEGVGIVGLEKEIKYIPVEVTKMDIKDGDTILLTFNMDECDLKTIQNIHKLWTEALPNVNIISTVKPILDSVQIIRKEEDKPF